MKTSVGIQPATTTDHRFVETASDHEHTARQQCDAAIVLLEAFRDRSTLLTSSSLIATSRLLESAARHLSQAEEWTT